MNRNSQTSNVNTSEHESYIPSKSNSFKGDLESQLVVSDEKGFDELASLILNANDLPISFQEDDEYTDSVDRNVNIVIEDEQKGLISIYRQRAKVILHSNKYQVIVIALVYICTFSFLNKNFCE
jgi:hypothetical protein